MHGNQVSCQADLEGELRTTYVTVMFLHPGVPSFVTLQVVRVHEAFPAVTTRMCIFPRVSLHVGGESSFCLENLLAQMTPAVHWHSLDCILKDMMYNVGHESYLV